MKKEELIIVVEKLKEGKNRFRFNIPPEIMEIDKPQLAKWVEYDVVLIKKGEKVILQGRVTTEVVLKCSRCLEEFKQRINESFEITYIKGKPSKTVEPVELSKFELDEEYYQTEINLLIPARDAILLSVPIAPLCRENCKGLCPICGINLNKKVCNCKKELPESPFAVLKEILKKK